MFYIISLIGVSAGFGVMNKLLRDNDKPQIISAEPIYSTEGFQIAAQWTPHSYRAFLSADNQYEEIKLNQAMPLRGDPGQIEVLLFTPDLEGVDRVTVDY